MLKHRKIAIVLTVVVIFQGCTRSESIKQEADSVGEASGVHLEQKSTVDFSSTELSDNEDEPVSKRIGSEDKPSGEEGDQSEESTKGKPEKRAIPAVAMLLMKNPKVQEAVIEKGIEVAGKLVDKQLKIIDEAQEKAENFLKKEIKLDIVPDKSWATDNLYVPPGYHFHSAIIDEDRSQSREAPDVPYVYPAGIGSVMMNGCYGRDYKASDPCYNLKAVSSICLDQIDGASFLGVGFDGRGKYSPESRKMSIVQRNCKNKASYDGFDVPDTMNVHGIYDTSASMYTFQGREEYTSFLQEEAGVSGSVFGFYAGAREAWGSSTAETKNSFLALLDVNIERYEIFMDEVKPGDLSLNFLREFMELPLSYYSPGSPIKYQDFIQRWGTHYIKSAKFGGQLEIRKTTDKETAQSKTHFAKMMEAEYKSLFSSFVVRSSTEEGTTANKAVETTSTSVVAQGGSHGIASILSDVYSPTFKNEFKHWLSSVPSYPKPFQFRMSPITDLVNFRATDLFPEEPINWGCEGLVTALKTEINENGEEVKYYERRVGADTIEKVYCPFDSRGGLEDAIKRRRSSLSRAIEVYMEEGTISISDFDLWCPEPEEGSGDNEETVIDTNNNRQNDLFSVKDVPKWEELTKAKSRFKVKIDMREDLKEPQHGRVIISKNMERRIRFFENRWFTESKRKVFHLYNGFDNGGSGNPKNKKISVLGLVLSFEEKTGRLTLTKDDFEESKKIFPALNANMIGSIVGQIKFHFKKELERRSKLPEVSLPSPAPSPPPAPDIQTCKILFSNALRFDPTEGKCLHFTAITAGTIYVVFAVSPGKRQSWYTVRIADDRVDIYKGEGSMENIEDENAVGLGVASIHQSFFVCVTESNKGVLIEYGKSQGSSDEGDVFLAYTDSEKEDSKPLNVRFYAFGAERAPVKIMDAHLLSRKLTRTTCRGVTWEDNPTSLCTQECDLTCDPLAGCSGPTNSDCNACRYAKNLTANGECLDHCPENTFLTSNDVCKETFEINGIGTNPLHFGLDDNMPETSAFTVSVWAKMEYATPTANKFSFSYSHSLPFSMNFVFEIQQSGFAMNIFIKDPQHTGLHESTVKFEVGGMQNAEDSQSAKWHFLSVTWSGLTGAVTLYLDGEQKEIQIASNNHLVTSFPGGGDFSFHVMGKTTVSSFNMWDHVLSSEVILRYAKGCNIAIGNLHEWYDLWPEVETESSRHTKPSSCSVIQNLQESEEENEGSGHQNDIHPQKLLPSKYSKKIF